MTRSEKYGKAEIRWQPQGEVCAGTVIRDGRRGEIFHHADEQRLLPALRNDAGKLEPGYLEYEEAVRRFLLFKPGGFEVDTGPNSERRYKEAAFTALTDALSPNAAMDATQEDAARVGRSAIWTNMLSIFETARLRETLLSDDGPRFLNGAARFLAGDRKAGIESMNGALASHGRTSWPLITYLPFLWDYRTQMFLKPAAKLDFSQRTGLSFHHGYEAAPCAEGYEDLLELVNKTRTAIARLSPRDNIDVQSFIWLIGEYREEDLP